MFDENGHEPLGQPVGCGEDVGCDVERHVPRYATGGEGGARIDQARHGLDHLVAVHDEDPQRDRAGQRCASIVTGELGGQLVEGTRRGVSTTNGSTRASSKPSTAATLRWSSRTSIMSRMVANGKPRPARPALRGGDHAGEQLLGLGPGKEQAHGDTRHPEAAPGGRGVRGEQFGPGQQHDPGCDEHRNRGKEHAPYVTERRGRIAGVPSFDSCPRSAPAGSSALCTLT